MTQTPEPIDLTAIEARYDTFSFGWIGYPDQPGETETQYRNRLRDAMDGDAVACAQDVGTLIDEIKRLRELLQQAHADADELLYPQAVQHHSDCTDMLCDVITPHTHA